MYCSVTNMTYCTVSHSPVGSQLVGYETSRDLRDDVAPEERAVDQAHCLGVPVKLCWLCNRGEEEEKNCRQQHAI